jgi:hypothetical protein
MLNTIIIPVAAVCIILPWASKYTGKWEKLKQWYSMILGGFVFAFIPTVISAFGTETGLQLAPSSNFIIIILDVVAAVFMIIGSAGVFKKLLWS